MSYLPSIAVLSAMGVVALVITVVRGGIRADAGTLRRAARMSMVAIVFQVAHFGEEAATGLNRELPGLFGLESVALESFVTINVIALAIWALSAATLVAGSSAGLFPLWFLAVASVTNAFLHPALALATDGYFPGVLTAPIVGVSGFLLLRALARITPGGQPAARP